jgi:uncharacterized lipoprotein YmbA
MTKFQHYDVYMGLFDKDSKTQKIDSVTALTMAQRMVARYYSGATVLNAYGVYTHDDGTVVIEPSIKFEITVFDKKDGLKEFVAEIKQVFNQESVSVQKSKVTSELM